MRRLALSFALLTACGESAATEPATEPAVEPAPEGPAEAPEAPAVPPAELPAAPPPNAPTGLLLPATAMLGDAGGVVFHENAFIRFGDGPVEVLVVRSNACAGDGRCTFTSDRCNGTTVTETNILPAGAWANTTVTATANAPEHEAVCARFNGTFSNGHPSDPAAGGPPPAPTFEGSDCHLRTQVVSVDRAICASFAPAPTLGGAESANYEVTTFRGACCTGEEVSRFAVPNDVLSAFVGADGRSIVVPRHEPSISREELAADPVLFLVVRPDSRVEVRLSQAFAGDPILAAGSGFGYQARISEGAIFVRTIGGAEHRIAY